MRNLQWRRNNFRKTILIKFANILMKQQFTYGIPFSRDSPKGLPCERNYTHICVRVSHKREPIKRKGTFVLWWNAKRGTFHFSKWYQSSKAVAFRCGASGSSSLTSANNVWTGKCPTWWQNMSCRLTVLCIRHCRFLWAFRFHVGSSVVHLVCDHLRV